jgi:hypothetical protein
MAWESVPLDAVTVTVELIGPDVPDEPPEVELPPQPLSRRIPTALNPRNNGRKRRLFQKTPKSPHAAITSGYKGRIKRLSAPVRGAVVTVSAVVALPPEGTTVAGEKLHDAPAGSPEHANVAGELNPLRAAIVTLVVPVWPALTVIVAELIATLKSAAA